MLRILSILFFISNLLFSSETIAVSYFDNTSDIKEFNPLSKGLADMLITDLSNQDKFHIVEREKLEKLIREIELGDSGFIDKNTAQELGKGLGATYMLTGSFLIIDETMRIDARLIDVGSGEIIMAEEITGEKNAFFELEKELVNKLINQFDIGLSRTQSRKINKVQTKSFDSFSTYSSALVELDDGNLEKSIILLEKATEFDEDFDKAWEKLENLEQRITDLLKVRESGLELEYANILDELSNGNVDVFSKLFNLSNTLLTSWSSAYSDFYSFYNDNDFYNKNYLSLDDKQQKIVSQHYLNYELLLNKRIIFHYKVLEIMSSNGLLNEPWAGGLMTIEELMSMYYVLALSCIFYHVNMNDDGNYPGIPNEFPDIFDLNGNIIIDRNDFDKEIIKICTNMMEKYPTGVQFTTFQSNLKESIEREKERREN